MTMEKGGTEGTTGCDWSMKEPNTNYSKVNCVLLS